MITFQLYETVMDPYGANRVLVTSVHLSDVTLKIDELASSSGEEVKWNPGVMGRVAMLLSQIPVIPPDNQLVVTMPDSHVQYTVIQSYVNFGVN